MITVNGVKFNNKEFHNGEVIFEKPLVVDENLNVIEMFFQSNKDITALLFAREYLAEKVPEAECHLVMKYCPYERMDREINNQMFSMKYFASIIDKFNFRKVYVLDPHSEVCVDLLYTINTDVHIIDLKSYIDKVVEDFKPDYICYPDKGAFNKYPKVLRGLNIPYFYGSKVRDLENKGRITSYELVNAPDLKGKKVLIIDDICCLGGTAYNAAMEMKMAGADEVAFYISHCENGIFAGKILYTEPFCPDEYGENLPWAGKHTIDRVYTADTMLLNKGHENIHIIDAYTK